MIDVDEELHATLDGRRLAPAWLSVALATGTAKDDLLFYRTLAVEFFPTGVRLAACNRYMWLWGFVPRQARAIALDPTWVGQLAKLGDLHGGAPLVWRFGGVDRLALVEIGEGPLTVRGGVMPVRWRYGEAETEAL